MNTQNLGIVSPVAMGDWQENFPYQKLNIVRHNGSSYIAKSGNSGIEPGVESGWSAYWMLLNTDVEGAQGPQGPAGEGVPTGGLTGQILSKNSNTNYDTKWVDPTPVSQTTGDSETEVMSQKAVTDEFGKRFTRAIICPPDAGLVSFDTKTKQLYIPDMIYIVNGVWKTFGASSTVDLSAIGSSDVHIFINITNNAFHAVPYSTVSSLSSIDFAYFCSVRSKPTATYKTINLPFPYLVDGKMFGVLPADSLSARDMFVGDSEIDLTAFGLVNYTIEGGALVYWAKRCTTREFIPIGSATGLTVSVADGYRAGVAFYREMDDSTYIGDLGGFHTGSKEVAFPDGANVFRVVVAPVADTTIGTDVSYATVIRHGFDFSKVSKATKGGTTYSYTGEKIPSKVNHFDSELALTMTYDGATETSQDIEIFGDYMFVAFSGTEQINVYSLTSRALLAEIPIDTHHGTGMQFSGEYYNEGDTFPLLYIGGWTDQLVAALRITETDGSWTATAVRTITIPTECGYYPAPSIDAKHNVLYCYGYKQASNGGDDNAMVLSKFDLNTQTNNGDGTYSAKLLSTFESPYLGVIQGRKYYQGRLYVGFTDEGATRNSRLVVVDAATGDVKSFVDMTAITSSENEGVCYQVDGDNIYWYYSDYFNVFKLTF